MCSTLQVDLGKSLGLSQPEAAKPGASEKPFLICEVLVSFVCFDILHAETAAPKVTPIRKTQVMRFVVQDALLHCYADQRFFGQDDETPMFKVILLGDTDYEQSHVVTQITKVRIAVSKCR